MPKSFMCIGLLCGLSLTLSFPLYAQERFLRVDKNSLYEQAEDGNDTITIYSGVNWTLDFCPPFNLGRRTGGPGTTRVVLHFARNLSSDPVFTHIRIEPSGSSDIHVVTVDVIQAGRKPFIRIDKQEITENAGGGIDTVTIVSDAPWLLYVPEGVSWIRAYPLSGPAGKTKVLLTIGANGDPRLQSCAIGILSAAGCVKKIVLSQAPRGGWGNTVVFDLAGLSDDRRSPASVPGCMRL